MSGKAAAFHFAARGWVLAVFFLALLVARAMAGTPLRPAWLLLVAAGILLRAWAGAHLGPHGNAARAQAPALATTGPYRFSRNPLYVANLLVAAGVLSYANALAPAATAVFLLALVVHHALLVRHEERALGARFGATYAGYRRAVPRWIGWPTDASTPRAATGPRATPSRLPALTTLLVRQGRNVAYALAAVLLVWIAAR